MIKKFDYLDNLDFSKIYINDIGLVHRDLDDLLNSENAQKQIKTFLEMKTLKKIKVIT